MVQRSMCCSAGVKYLIVILGFSALIFVSSESCSPEEESQLCPVSTTGGHSAPLDFQCSQNAVASFLIVRAQGDGWTCDKIDDSGWRFSCTDGTETRDPDCAEESVALCHPLAYCSRPRGTPECACPAGLYGDGEGEADLSAATGCSSESYVVRMVVDMPDGHPALSQVQAGTGRFGRSFWDGERASVANLFFSGSAPDHVISSVHHAVLEEPGAAQVTINVLFATEQAARDGATAVLNAVSGGAVTLLGIPINREADGEWQLDTDIIAWGPRVYTWSAGTTSDAPRILPTGLTVDSVSFDLECMSSGCWEIEVTYTTGEDNFNAFFLPKTDNSPTDYGNPDLTGPWYDSEAADHDYDSLPDNNEFPWSTWGRSPGSTFLPASFPCGADAYNAGSQIAISACCIVEFLDMYRPVQTFVTQMNGTAADIRAKCAGVSDIVSFNAPGQAEAEKLTMPSAAVTGYSLFGGFAGMAESLIEPIGLSFTDPTIRQYRARLRLDEVELRRFAGQFRGTVGVEHTVDTFVGVVDFKPTGSAALDAFATQANVHLEKTSYFSVSTHGVNDYTFIQYINLRLVEVLKADATLGETQGQQDTRTNRTSTVAPAHYLQVTFTLGTQYEPMGAGTAESEIIPLDSVRVGNGGRFSSQTTQDTMYHACTEYTNPAEAGNTVFDQDTLDTFDSRFDADCAPAAAMCVNPTSIPDSFVSFNVPLGIEWLPAPSAQLASQVFVELVVSAQDKEARSTGDLPNDGSAPWQMKTTLFAAIPVVEGGVQIFCDEIVAKVDLQDVVNATLLFGTANSEAELTRLRMFADIGDSVLTPRDPVDFEDTDSIESGLMTLVITGDASYFGITDGGGQPVGAGTYGLQLEDVVTVHVMEQDPDFDGANTVSKRVRDLLALPGQDNYDSLASDAELRTRGYNLNGAFRFSIDRATQRASLHPTDALLQHCSFRPSRATAEEPFPTTCVTRRDVQGRAFPVQPGSNVATATEVVSAQESDVSGNRAFMQSVLGASNYAAQLGEDFSRAVAARWKLNDRYRRAYWINPGYEWTPTQTGGAPIFSISQKLFFFALIALDESFGNGRRRALLSSYSAVDASQGGMGVSSTSVGFKTDPATLIANLLEVPPEQVTKWEVKVQLTREQACMDRAEMRARLREQLEEGFKASASHVLDLQIVYAVVDMADEQCDGVVVRRAQAAASSATALFDVLLTFSERSATINPTTLLQQPGVLEFNGVALPEVIILDASFDVDPGEYTPPPSEDDAPLGLDWNVIYGVIGGVGGLVLLLVVFGVRYCRNGRFKKDAQEAEIVTVMYLRDVKADLADDMLGSRNGSHEVEAEKAAAHNEFEGMTGSTRRRSNDFENAFSSPSHESRGDIF